jgi:hypothetical protein
MIVREQQIYRKGTSKVIAIPSQLAMGERATIAANRLMLVDPRGEISKEELGWFLESEIEPKLWAWLAKKQGD